MRTPIPFRRQAGTRPRDSSRMNRKVASLCFFVVTGALASSHPEPPKTTQLQRTLLNRAAEIAKEASSSARNEALLVLASVAFRSELKKLAPSLADVPAATLLARWREEVYVERSKIPHTHAHTHTRTPCSLEQQYTRMYTKWFCRRMFVLSFLYI